MITKRINIFARAIGSVEILVDGKRVWEGPNAMLAGMGCVFADALITGTSKKISNMYAHREGGAGRTAFSTPVRTEGGHGTEDHLIVQSAYTNISGSSETFDQFWLSVEPFDQSADYLDIATVDNDKITVPNTGVLTINWKIQIPSGTCPFEAAQRYQLAKGISPEAGFGGTIYAITQGKFVWAAGDSGLQARHDATGGGGYSQKSVIDVRYTHGAAAVTVIELEFYNSNAVADLVQERTGVSFDLANGETAQTLLSTTWLGVSE